MKTRILLLFLLCFVSDLGVNAEISSSSDLNCDFTASCRWRNSSDAPGHFETANLLEADAMNRIMPLDEHSPKPFTFTAGLMGRQMALLVSEVITCQLGGASIKYWYYKTGLDSQLEVCIRQPPGNRDLSQMRCYDGVSSTFGKQWIFRAVELPPIAQPFEIVFKTIYSPPSSVIALDNIVFEATLCGYGRERREIRRIGYHDWQSYRSSNLYNGELMLIVAQDVADRLKENKTTTTVAPTSLPIGLEARIEFVSTTPEPTTTTTEPSSTTTSTTTTTVEPSTTTAPVTSSESPTSSEPSASNSSTTTAPAISNEQQFANFVNFLKQTAPVLPYIPTLVRSLTALDPRSADELVPGSAQLPVQEVRRSPVTSSHFYNTNQPTLVSPESLDGQAGLVDLAKKFGLWEETSAPAPAPTPMGPPMTASGSSNTFGLPNKITEAHSSIYPANLLKKKITMNPIKKLPQFSPSPRTPDLEGSETESIEELHQRIFRVSTTTPSPMVPSSTELIIFKQPSTGETEVAEKLADIAKLLPSGAVQDLTALRNIPDLDGLTKGMDLTDIKKPGGFGRLKKQFMERLMRRTLGLPMESPDVKVLPPPIVPMKVTRKMMAEMMKRKAARRRAV